MCAFEYLLGNGMSDPHKSLKNLAARESDILSDMDNDFRVRWTQNVSKANFLTSWFIWGIIFILIVRLNIVYIIAALFLISISVIEQSESQIVEIVIKKSRDV